ncbi:MAG: GC-type dockerin domain-anchored protein, partial [Planctomycetota bacterium]
IDDGAFPNTYDGVLRVSGSRFAFDVDVTQDNVTLLGPVTDTRLVFNRSGTIDALRSRRCLASFAAPASVIDQRDIIAYLERFRAGSADADLTEDGKVDFFDIRSMLSDIRTGCLELVCERP